MRSRSYLVHALVLSTLLITLTACWIPERFSASVTVNKDGSYTFSYDGTLLFALPLSAEQYNSLGAKDEAVLQNEAGRLRQYPGFKRVDYQGKGRCRVLFEKAGKPGEPLYFVSKEVKFFTVLFQPDKTVNVSAIRLSQTDIQQLGSMGAKMEGTFSVSVARGVEVLRHNAEAVPYLFGILGSYSWHIQSPSDNPFIIVKPVT